MKAVFVGLPERDTFALSLLVGKYFPTWTYQAQEPAHICLCGELFVLDAEGCAKQGGATSAMDWLQAVRGKPTVLITGHMSDEAEQHLNEHMAATPAAQSLLVRLQRPFGAQDMRDALQALERKAAEQPAAAPPASAQPAPPLPDCTPACTAGPTQATQPPLIVFDSSRMPSFVSSATPMFNLDSGAPPAPEPAAQPLPELGDGQLTLQEFLECMEHCPSAESRAFFEGFVEQMASGHPFEMMLTLINRLIFHVGEGWVASSTPVSVLRVVMRSRSLGRLVRYTDLGADIDPRARAEQRGMKIYPLEDFFYVLAALAEAPLSAKDAQPQAPSVP